jgi:hypothetical protein
MSIDNEDPAAGCIARGGSGASVSSSDEVYYTGTQGLRQGNGGSAIDIGPEYSQLLRALRSGGHTPLVAILEKQIVATTATRSNRLAAATVEIDPAASANPPRACRPTPSPRTRRRPWPASRRRARCDHRAQRWGV